MRILTCPTVFIICILFWGCDGKSFRVLNESLSIADADFVAYKVPYNVNDWRLTGRLVVVDPFDACDEIKNGNDLIGNIALVNKYTCSRKDKVERLKEFNVSAVIIFNQQVVAQFAFDDQISKEEKVCEVFSVAQRDTADLKKAAEKGVLLVQIDPITSPWWDLEKNGALVFYSVFYLSIEVAGIALAGYKSFCFWNVKKYRWSVPTTALGLLICTFVGIHVQIPIHMDPEGTRFFYSIPVRNNIFTLSFPFVMSVSILIAFYWQAAISAVYNARFLPSNKKFLIPVGITCVVFMLLECIRVGLGLSSPDGGSATLVTVIFFMYLVAIEAASIFYIISASRVLWFLRSTKSTRKTAKATRLTSWLLVSAACYLLMPFFFAIALIPVSTENSALFMLLFIADGLYHLVQFSLVMAFQAPSLSGETTMERTSSLDKPSSTRNEDMASIELS